MFQTGEKVVYPMHGAGIVTGIEKRKIMGEEHTYYVFKMSLSSMQLMIPTDNAENIGVRKIISESAANETITYFHSCEEETEDNWNKRYHDSIDRLKTGDIFKVAQVTKSLILRNKRKSLSNAEKKLLINAKNILISELTLAKGQTTAEIEKLLFID